jgi:hypothetical protein
MNVTAVSEPTVATVRRLGIDWCLEHRQPLSYCCASKHNWGSHNALRRYTGLMVRGKAHPFTQAGGTVTGVKEGPEALAAALANATTERVSLATTVATQPVTAQHIGLMLRGRAPDPRLGNHDFEFSDHPTVIRHGPYHVIADGHHRLTAAWANGETHLKARVLSGVTPVFANDDSLMFKP